MLISLDDNPQLTQTLDNWAARYVARRPSKLNPCDPLIYHEIQSLLDQCQDYHALCRPRCTPDLPTRVLNVSPNLGASIRLYAPQEREQHDYVTLSYCWGGPQTIKTTTKTINSYLNSIDLHILPQKIQYAIIVTRKLGFKYLWIDAFCIIQDSSEDKAREIAKMAKIYNYSIVTIAAASASKVSDGFLRLYPKLQEGTKAPFSCPDGSVGEVEILKRQEVDESTEPLNLRAWTFQERLLHELSYSVKKKFSGCVSRVPMDPNRSLKAYTGMCLLRFICRQSSFRRKFQKERGYKKLEARKWRFLFDPVLGEGSWKHTVRESLASWRISFLLLAESQKDFTISGKTHMSRACGRAFYFKISFGSEDVQ